MKRLIFFPILALFMFSACIEGDTYVDESTIIEGSLKSVYTATIQPSQWLPSGTYGAPGYYLYATIEAPFITNYVLDKGAVMIYTYFDGFEVQLPYIISRRVDFSNFVEILSYESEPGYLLEPGYLSFILDASDFQADPYPSPLVFKIVVIE